MATKLQLWNRALYHLGEGMLVNIDPAVDGTEPAYVFDEMWPTVVLDALSHGDWNFATKTAAIPQSGSTTVIPNYTYAYDHPADWIRTVAFSEDGDFTDHAAYDLDSFDVYDERGSWFTNLETLYVRYITSDLDDDDDIPSYPPSFFEYCALLLAHRACERLTQGARKNQLTEDLDVQLIKAKSNDARNMPKATVRTGKWLRSFKGAGGRGKASGTLVGGEITTTEGST